MMAGLAYRDLIVGIFGSDIWVPVVTKTKCVVRGGLGLCFLMCVKHGHMTKTKCVVRAGLELCFLMCVKHGHVEASCLYRLVVSWLLISCCC